MELESNLQFSKLYEDIDLYTTADKFYLQPVESENVILIIDRVNEEKKLEVNKGQIPPTSTKKRIYGVLGIITLISGPYLIVVTKRKRIGPISSQNIYQIEATEIISFSRSLLNLNQVQMDMNKRYLSMLETVLDTPYFYFSYTYDLTHTMQRLYKSPSHFLSIPMHGRADKRFLWNAQLLQKFCTSPEFTYFALPVIHGFVSINPITFETTSTGSPKTFLWTVVSRRSCKRAGTRLFRRGIDSGGNVANYVETEQIIEFEGNHSSYVQIRGSIPLYWSQYPNLHLKSPIAISSNDNHAEACAKHMDELVNYYNEVVVVNLIDHRGHEEKLEKRFKEVVDEIRNKKVRYEAFDFHQECKHMRWDRLQILIDRLSYEQDNYKYFFLQRDGKLLCVQNGVFRTNCVDCLDRTNVVQSLFAKRNLIIVLERMGLIYPEKGISIPDDFERLYKNFWADHANVLSTQYSGANALKTDFTRTGKRTYYGMLSDGWNTLLRFYKNNLKDGLRQDAIDLFLGNYVVKDGECISIPCPIDKVPSWKYVMFTVILLMAIAMFFANAIFPSEYSTGTLLFLLFWAAMITVTFITIIRYGTEFVDHPKLTSFRKN